MSKSLRWKITLMLVLMFFTGITLLPSFGVKVPQWWTKYLSPGSLKLGLDLQGGMHLVLRVDLDKAIENSLEFACADLEESLREEGITMVRADTGDPHRIQYTLPNTSALEKVQKIIGDDFPNLAIDVQAEAGTFPRLFVRLSDERAELIRKNAVNQALEIIRNRIDQFGVSEPVIVRQGADEIVVQLPGVKDPQRAMNLIGQTAQLQFKLVADPGPLDLAGLVNQEIQAGRWQMGGDRRELNRLLADRLPPGTELYFETSVDPQTKLERRTPLLVQKQVMMTGDMIKDAQPRIGGSFNEPLVSLEFTGRGAKIFAKVTSENVGRRFAIILDDVVKSAPVIREKILGGSAQITGNFTYDEARDLAIVLRVGALPAPVEVIQNLTVGASLGHDSIQRGLVAGLCGAALVFLFMIVYYRFSGVVADVALLVNIGFLFAGLAALQATLTLPGIAGIILSIGMGVDSNVLIFERMREEFALGKTVKSGVEAGFDKAFWSIVDSQVTTLITALALFLFGTGPIKGFAVTLSLGIIFNLFTTLFGTRLVYDYFHQKGRLKPLHFLQFVRRPNFDYMAIRKYTFAFSGALVLIGLVAFVQILRGQANMGVDFTGGTMLQYSVDKPFTLADARKALADIDGVDLQQVVNENRLIVKIKQSEDTVGERTAKITAALAQGMPDHTFTLDSETEIGSSVSETLRNKALEAILISLAGVLLYLAVRFDIRFGVAAAAATFHDVLAVLGICWLTNTELTLLIVTALLTLAGYSLNDTVVVFDRIRELTKKHGTSMKLTDLINLAINQVFGRSLVTSLTTLLVLMALFFFGGSVIHDFSFILLAGIIVGTYSSVFVAGALLTVWKKKPA